MGITKESVMSCVRSSGLTLATMFGVIGGVIFGLVLRSTKEQWTDREVMYVSYVGELFLRMLKALILPLIVPSLITAVGSLDMSLSGRVGGRAIGYYMATTVLAVILGIILVTSIHPGVSGQEKVNIVFNSCSDFFTHCAPKNLSTSRVTVNSGFILEYQITMQMTCHLRLLLHY